MVFANERPVGCAAGEKSHPLDVPEPIEAPIFELFAASRPFPLVSGFEFDAETNERDRLAWIDELQSRRTGESPPF
jgi:hypothetical protein